MSGKFLLGPGTRPGIGKICECGRSGIQHRASSIQTFSLQSQLKFLYLNSIY
jgi:hypothetical protein